MSARQVHAFSRRNAFVSIAIGTRRRSARPRFRRVQPPFIGVRRLRLLIRQPTAGACAKGWSGWRRDGGGAEEFERRELAGVVVELASDGALLHVVLE